MNGKRILLIENFSSDFYKARLPLAKYLISKGWDVYALIPNDEYVELIKKSGIKVIGYDLNRKNKGIRQLIKLIGIYRSVIRKYDIDIIHSFRFQPNLLNVLANFFNSRKVFLHVTGLGIAFSNFSFSYLLLRFASQFIFQIKLLRANKIIFQNDDDVNNIMLARFYTKKVVVINGSGVDTNEFSRELFDKVSLRRQMSFLDGDKIFICITRLIWEKGIDELTTAFQNIEESYRKNTKLLIVGWPDKDNPRHVDDLYIDKFKNNDVISFLGKRNNISELLAISDVFIYPSYYREGVPRGILEALSMGLPIITTDMPGCKLTVKQEKNGYLISPKSSEAIGGIVMKILKDNRLNEMGCESRIMAVNYFSNTIIFSEIENLYSII